MTFWRAAALVPAMAMMAASAMGQTAGAMKFRGDWKAASQYFANVVVIGPGSELYRPPEHNRAYLKWALAGPQGAALSVVDNASAAVGILSANRVIVTTPDDPVALDGITPMSHEGPAPYFRTTAVGTGQAYWEVPSLSRTAAS